MRSIKRVILANRSRLLREMLRRAIDKADHLEVVREVPNQEELTAAIETFEPEWVIASFPVHSHANRWIHDYPSVRFLFLSPDQNHIKMRWQASREEVYSDLSLKEFIHILETDLQRT